MNDLQNQIDELRKKLESIPLANDVKLAFKDNMDKALDLIEDNKNQLNELKEDIKNINKILRVITEGRVLELKVHENLEEVLREDYKFKIEKLPNNELKKHYKGLLAKLEVGSARQTEKKDWINELYKISQFWKKKYEECLFDSKTEKKEVKFVCGGGCGDFTINEIKNAKSSEDPTLVCPKCGSCSWFITSIKEAEKIMEKWKEASGGVKECDHDWEFRDPENLGHDMLFCKKCGYLRDSKPPEPNCENCDDFIEDGDLISDDINPLTNLCFFYRKTKCPQYEPREDDKEIYELYLTDKEQFYFKKINYPFTELNNMVHLAIGKIVVNRSDRQELISKFMEKILAFNYALPAEPQIIAIREWLEEKLK